MKIYLKEAKTLAESFKDFQLEAIPRQSNQEVDALSKYAWQAMPLQVHFLESIHEGVAQKCANVNMMIDWAAPMHTYGELEELLEDEIEAKMIK